MTKGSFMNNNPTPSFLSIRACFEERHIEIQQQQQQQQQQGQEQPPDQEASQSSAESEKPDAVVVRGDGEPSAVVVAPPPLGGESREVQVQHEFWSFRALSSLPLLKNVLCCRYASGKHV